MFSSLKKRIEETMAGENADSSSFLESFLNVASKTYGLGVTLRSRMFDSGVTPAVSLPCPVISVGNITVGGTGKTPMTLFLADHLKKQGMKPVILSRGYGGTASKDGGMVSDGKSLLLNPAEAGDEPYLMASLLKDIPVCVGRRRYETGMDAYRRFKPDLFILDDGFQHRRLKRDLDIVLLDAGRPFGNGCLLPRGPLREPLQGLGRADVFVLTRSIDFSESMKQFRELTERNLPGHSIGNIPVFCCSHQPFVRGVVTKGTRQILPYDREKHRSTDVFAFSGIAKNYDFRKGLAGNGFTVKGFIEYPDHHPYGEDDLAGVVDKAVSSGCPVLATSEKDAVRLSDKKPLPLDLLVMGVSVDFGVDENRFVDFIKSRVTSQSAR